MLVFSAPASAGMSAGMKKALRSGKIVIQTLPGSGVQPCRGTAIIKAPAKHVFQVLANVTAYPKFMPRVASVRQAGSGRYRLKAKFPWPFNDIWVLVQTDQSRRGSIFKARWKQIDGSFKHYQGMAWVQPWGANKSVITYQMLVDFDAPIPAALMRAGLQRATWRTLQSIRAQAHKTRPTKPKN